MFYCSNAYAQAQNEDDVKKQAAKYFDDEEYNSAYKLYAQLLSNYPKDPEYNYRLGVCMLFTEADKKKPIPYLLFASNHPKDAPKDAKFYLAKAYHMNYKFDEALKLYTEYKAIGSAGSIKKLHVDKEIQACKNGKRLLSNLSDLIVISKKQLSEADYFRSYDVKEVGGKLLVKPDEFKTGYDKKKKDKSVIYLPKNSERIYYSSYGENGENGRDIYFANKLPNGEYGKPIALPAAINTEYDEDYPFIHPNGTTLYFSSKGHNSMGGYDVFKTNYDPQTQPWSKPVNLDFPINSPDDDILFLTDSLEKTAFFSTGRYSPYGKIDVLKVNTERKPLNFAVLKGTVVKEDAAQSLKSKITVKNISNGEIVGTYQAQDNGDYNMELPNGGKFIFTVETPGITTQSESVQIPVAYTLKPYKQIISYDKKILKIINRFDGEVADESYSMMLDLIEKKAKLEISENDVVNNTSKEPVKNQNTNNINSVTTTNPTPQTSEPKTNTNKDVTNEQLLNIAKEDAKDASEEASKLKQEAQNAFDLATQKTAEATAAQKEADEAILKANAIQDITTKNNELEKANELKENAKIATDVATTATNMAKRLEVDANQKQQEADLTNQYIKQLEEITKNKNNKVALAKLEEIQKELDALSKQKNQSDELFASLKAEAELKQNELKKSEKKKEDILSEINAIKTETKNLETDFANESDKSLKDNITAQIRELKNDVELKNKDLEISNQKIENLKNELDGLNKEIVIAGKILNEKTDDITANSTSNNTNKSNPITYDDTAAEPTTPINSNDNKAKPSDAETISNKYAALIAAVPNNSDKKEDILTQNQVLKNYNEELTSLIAKNKTKLSTINNTTEKQGTEEEIKKLEQLKTENEKTIITNDNKVKQLESLAITSNPTKTENPVNPIATNDQNTSNNNPTKNNEPTTTETKNEASKVILNEATALSDKASNLRNEAISKKGRERDSLLKQATENEKLAVDKKLEASIITQKENNNQFVNNAYNLSELQKLTGDKTNDDISQANLLADEAVLYFNQAKKMREEAEDYPMGSAKLGKLESVDEKEKDALAKQTKALEILSKINPNYKLKNADPNFTPINANNTAFNKQPESTTNTNQPEIKAKDAATTPTAVASTQTNTTTPISTNSVTTNSLAVSNTPTLSNTQVENVTPQNINTLSSEADKLTEEATQLRQAAATKSDAEKAAADIEAKKLETKATAIKTDVANKQQQLNLATYQANQQSLKELAEMAKGKNIRELANVNEQIDEANIIFSQAKNLREEADATSSPSAKLGGYGNAEEKEAIAIAKQEELIKVYKKYFSNYVPKNPVVTAIPNANNANQLAVDSLLSLSKTIDTEYKKLFLALPTNLKANQQALKTKAQASYKKNQNLITQANQTTNLVNKKRLLITAKQSAQDAVNLLNQINTITAANLANSSTNTPTIAANVVNTARPQPETAVKLSAPGVELKNTNAYNASKPIPVNEKLPDGLIYKVQIGAFKALLPDNTFKGLTPIIAQSTPNGYIRYMAGSFEQYENANAIKNDLQKLGYNDAFVVVYLNGKRISLNEAKATAPNTNAVANTTNPNLNTNATNNTPTNSATPNTTRTTNIPANTANEQPVVVTKELEQLNGLLFTVQIGVYSREVTNAQLYNLKPIFTEKLPNGLYRYTAGIYNDAQNLLNDKRKLTDMGVTDAFISSYYNAKRIPFGEGRKLQIENKNLKMEAENPIIFPASVAAIPNTNVPANANPATVTPPNTNTGITPFNNGVSSSPAPTPENGVKSTEEGISYKVQIGAYKNQVPNDVASKFLNIKTWPVTNVSVNGLFIYNIGNFTGISFAKKLKDEAVAVGITDAFITVYKDGKKLYGTEAAQYLNR